MKQLEEKFKNEILENLKVELNKIIKKDTIGIFKGLIDTYNEFINDKNYLNKIESIVDEVMEYDINDYDSEDDLMEMKGCDYIDFIDRYFLKYYVKKLVENLINLGEYDDNYWISEHEEINDKTNYGVIWDNYYDVDTCVRETLGDILDNELIEYLRNK
jgi:hypothetical protein